MPNQRKNVAAKRGIALYPMSPVIFNVTPPNTITVKTSKKIPKIANKVAPQPNRNILAFNALGVNFASQCVHFMTPSAIVPLQNGHTALSSAFFNGGGLETGSGKACLISFQLSHPSFHTKSE